MALSSLSSDNLKTIEDAFFQWCSRKKQRHISFLVTGKTGVGKSRLVNALLGKEVDVEIQGKDNRVCIAMPQSFDVDGVEVCVWDHPSKQEDSSDEDLTKRIHQEMDVMIHCLKMDERRFHEDDKCVMRALTEAFGEENWKNAVIALTFANNVKDPDGRKEDKPKFFESDLQYWRKAIEDFFTGDLNMNSEDVKAIPIVPTGNYRKLHLPNCENWLSELWVKCYYVMKDSGALNLYRINRERVKFPGSDKMAAVCDSLKDGTRQTFTTTAGTSHGDNTNMPREIALNEHQQDSFWKKTWKSFTGFHARVESAIERASPEGQKILQMFFCPPDTRK